ncbi:MAG: isochorismate synthase, partial [Chloroflexi bacterium]|nr:isochorismate synthase [Chloroflexota bacterium]
GPARFERAGARVAALGAGSDGAVEQLRWLGGFGFWDGDGESVWAGFPGLLFVLPELLLRVEAGRAWLVAAGALGDRARLEGRLNQVARQLAATADGGSSPGSARDREPEAPVEARREATGLAEPVARVVAAIREGRADKVVLASSRQVWLDRAADPLAVLQRFRDGQPDCSCFLVGPTPAAAFVGATPECLLRVTGRRVETMALAGSAPRGADPAEDARLGARLLSSAKDRREHALVVEAIVAELRGAGAVKVVPGEGPRLRRLATIQHLETRLAAELATPMDPLSLAARLHPTPALGGSPRDAALALIRELEEPRPGRGWYAGGVGWLDGRGDGELSVAIRSVLLRGRLALATAGAGLVASSDPEAEAREIALKLRVALAALGAGDPSAG